MARWEPEPRERLLRAALELFEEQGYDSTTVVQIATRAGLTKSTFFRHYPDKREVLFAGEDLLCRLTADGIAAAEEAATPLEAVVAALQAAAEAFVEGRRDYGPRLIAVIAGNRELRERSAMKEAAITAAMAEALQKRGVAERTALIAAELGGLAMHRAYALWASPANRSEFAELAQQELAELRSAAADL
ncbi:TetR/AcrR family transcriptional regulator [Kribbella sandramycini]|uniref:AcrR family transcriptional regulator n=1 Tax=Kribbella sandramycini TaxID=60450 RepID=A0A7Y4NYL9_9ACTN|nr:TetR/AcrR family transcriptional regulator [Kribbella sandramycini]MBB6569495.1 AcrR family transcriptional regulator [Kribbella sandramycini]NOL40671.1 TetR/AcrR family transcriptional regulator [Kribbella sandramycini]